MWMIMSDSHDNVPKVSRAIDLAIERGVYVVFHCGDLVSPFTARELLRYKGTLHVVFGNNDGERIGLKNLLGSSIGTGPLSLQVEGRKVVMMHEPFGLNDTIMADYIFYGHTHRIDTNLQGDRLVLNPGESCGYLTGRSTVVLLDPANRSYEVVEI